MHDLSEQVPFRQHINTHTLTLQSYAVVKHSRPESTHSKLAVS